jgi:hypothetical protein
MYISHFVEESAQFLSFFVPFQKIIRLYIMSYDKMYPDIFLVLF